LVTSASKGLGHAIAEELAKEGAHIFICAESNEDLEKAAEMLRA
jgi:NAD(P)-dependent dehydrogenase (short-subunit alcohol dehydrogenase family)